VNSKEQQGWLQAARLQADLMGVELVIVAWTDALSATFIDTNIDPLDHPYILGQVDMQNPELLMTFPEAGVREIINTFPEIEKQKKCIDAWSKNCTNLSLNEARVFARELGFELNFNWEACRSEEGYYRVKGNVEYCVKRGLKFGEYADMLWMETPTPDINIAKEFAQGIFAENPNLMLSYNLSPSFNWEASGLNDQQIKEFIPALAKLGYCWQFITLAGFHLNALMTEILAKQLANKDMLSYVNLIQRQEKVHNVDQLKHQKWSGVELRDREVELSQPYDVSTKATSEGITEVQFHSSKL